jgi:hypothetical protein
MPIQLTIERQTRKFDSGTVGIGRGPENQFSLPDDLRLAPSHAILKPINNRWIIESRDGGPVRIGSGRPVQFAWLNSGDVIQLTEAGPELVFEVVAAPRNNATKSKRANSFSGVKQLCSQGFPHGASRPIVGDQTHCDCDRDRPVIPCHSLDGVAADFPNRIAPLGQSRFGSRAADAPSH